METEPRMASGANERPLQRAVQSIRLRLGKEAEMGERIAIHAREAELSAQWERYRPGYERLPGGPGPDRERDKT